MPYELPSHLQDESNECVNCGEPIADDERFCSDSCAREARELERESRYDTREERDDDRE